MTKRSSTFDRLPLPLARRGGQFGAGGLAVFSGVHQQVTDHQPAGLALPQTLAAAVTWLSPGRSPPD